MAKKSDPTQTLSLRRQFLTSAKARLREVRADVSDLISSTRFQNATAAVRSNLLKSTLTRSVDAHLDSTNPLTGRSWASSWAEAGYKKGVERAYYDAKKYAPDSMDAKNKSAFVNDIKRKYQDSLMAAGDRAEVAMQAIASDLRSQIVREVSSLAKNGASAKEMDKAVKDITERITNKRVKPLTSDSIVESFAEGQLDSFSELGVSEVGVDVEFVWVTAGDENVCPQCQDQEGKTYSIEDARGLIPLHPNCRCAFVPSVPEPKPKKRKGGKSKNNKRDSSDSED